MSERETKCVKDVLNAREYQAVTKLLEEVNDRNVKGNNVADYVEEIRQTLNTISHRKSMLTHALSELEKYLESGKRHGEFEENITGSRLLDA